ncbi:hypothetical protein CTAM01_10397 [Colletotrichum tamarilloi]|uniref:C2H2-type domain-containing protein n=1 Tax=Colletotrichum tamarilloi TaxID=1209934 RepID=A0ABQ9R0S9_9PEZI|nr:uncharacterized protein CTAM01_10397 [Colletotrichum tamarilloi]KAK1491282.1 hypothetical protein CTAM01_10397 [Colletotrichum tamarilloi]
MNDSYAMAGAGENHRRSESSEGLMGEDKTFSCTHPGCNRRFTRAEHMQRHALNHMPGGLSCDLCNAHFKRPDLLKRHMDRHRQKDLEAGGPGCGVLDTRKRSWKAPDGSVVEKRPCPNPSGRGRASGGKERPQAQQVPSPDPEPHDGDHSLSGLDIEPDQDYSIDNISPEFHRRSTLDLRPGSQGDAQQYSIGRQDVFNPTEPVTNFSGFPPSLQFSDFIGSESHFDINTTQSSSWGETSFMSEQLDYDQIFQPDTASSFNMPYTTALDYNWLFNMQENSALTAASRPSNLAQDFETHMANNQSQTKSQANVAITPESMKSAQLWTEPMEMTSKDQERQRSSDPPNNTSTTASEAARRQAMRNSRERSSDIAQFRRPSDAPSAARQRYPAPSRPTPTEPERPLSSLRKPLTIPPIGEDVRERLLNVIDGAKPSLPDQRATIWEHPLLSADSLKSYLELFFTRFNTAYPLIHLETFDCRNTEPLLLLSILLLGATYSSKDCHQLAVCIHDVIRPSIFAHAGFSPRPELWTLQTILLVECFGKSRAGQKQHDMSHLFHGLLINLIRRSDCQTVRPPGPPPVSGEDNAGILDQAWRKWADAEQKKSFEMGWRKLLSTAYDAWKNDFDAFCGSFASQLQRGSASQAQGVQRQEGDEDMTRKVEFESFAAAYKALYHSAQALLNMDFLDVQIYAGARHILGRPVQQRDYHRSAQVVKKWAASACETQQQQQNHPLVPRQDRGGSADTNADQSKQSASEAAWHAARMLVETKRTLNSMEAMNLFHVPWCLYLATLTCWAYHHARPSRSYGASSRRAFDAFDDEDDFEDDEMIWDPQGEMEALVASMSERAVRGEVALRRERKRTNGLVWIMADVLTTVRWGIVHAGVVVLRGLVPQRLINHAFYTVSLSGDVFGRSLADNVEMLMSEFKRGSNGNMTAINYYERITEVYRLDNTPILIASAVSFIIGYLQYTYVVRLTLREGKGPMPFWMHSFYLAHDSTWSYTLGKAASQYGEHWYLRGTSIALLLWTMLEVWTIHRSITKERDASFGNVLGKQPSMPAAITYALALQMGMYSIVLLAIEFMGEGSVMQWFCFTNVLIVLGPTHHYLRAGSRHGLSLGFCVVNIIGTIWTFAPFGFFVLTIPEIFDQQLYYIIGVFLTVYSVGCFHVVSQYPSKTRVMDKGGKQPIW